MSATRIDVSLAKYQIGITGAIPSRGDWSEPAMDFAILEFVALFSGIVFKYGGRIVHGCHPAFTPVIVRQARLHSNTEAQFVHLVKNVLFYGTAGIIELVIFWTVKAAVGGKGALL